MQSKPSIISSIGMTLSDIGAIVRRNLMRFKRTPEIVIFSSIQPLMFLLLFNFVFGGAISASSGGSYINFLLPGIMAQTALFSTLQTPIALVADLVKGAIDRFRSLPMSRVAVLAGRTFADAIRMSFIVFLMFIFGTILGFRYQAGGGKLVAALALVVFFGYAFSWLTATLGLYIRNAEAVQTAGFFVTKPGQYHSSNTLPLKFPLFIKPPHRGHGIGIDDSSVVRSFAEYEQKIESILVNYSSSSLVEQYLSGREFSVAILEQPNGHESLVMPVEIIAQENSRGDRILGHRIKNQDKEEVIAVDTEVIKNCVSVLAKSVFIALGGKGYGRVDIRMSDAGTAYFLEANLSPGLGHGYLARACEINKKMSYETMILKIAELGLA